MQRKEDQEARCERERWRIHCRLSNIIVKQPKHSPKPSHTQQRKEPVKARVRANASAAESHRLDETVVSRERGAAVQEKNAHASTLTISSKHAGQHVRETKARQRERARESEHERARERKRARERARPSEQERPTRCSDDGPTHDDIVAARVAGVLDAAHQAGLGQRAVEGGRLGRGAHAGEQGEHEQGQHEQERRSSQHGGGDRRASEMARSRALKPAIIKILP
jgi:hypothetical protein